MDKLDSKSTIAGGREAPEVVAYIDGACLGNPGPGGWGALLLGKSRRRELSGGEANTTNNRMELTAAIKALEALKRSARVEIRTDSAYLVNGITRWLPDWQQRGWRTADKKTVKNRDLWESLLQLIHKHRVTWRWMKGHSGESGNERAHELATMAALKVKNQQPTDNQPQSA